jgi:hypothetical protein
MHDPLKKFAELAARGRAALAPPVDVTASVLADLRAVRPIEPVDRTMLVFSGLAMAAAVVVSAWGLDLWSTLSDPLAGLFQPVGAVMQ